MKRNLLAVMVIAVIAISGFWTNSAQAVEDKHHFGLFLNASQEISQGLNLTYHVSWPNYIGSQLPYTYVGLSHRFSDQVNLEGRVGYGFEAEDDDSGPVYALAPSFQMGEFFLYNDLEYWSGLNAGFSCHSLTYPVGQVRVGLDNANFYYFDKEDAESRFYRVGPSVRIPMGEHSTLGMMYYYQFENDGMDANLFKLTLSLSL
ncbi:MAG: hypothetical protein GF365_02485 [Candidatus Buchananbacteria bacterium]|nr:hypothetical protein [Candidatus Buchananbacteria bacterium]